MPSKHTDWQPHLTNQNARAKIEPSIAARKLQLGAVLASQHIKNGRTRRMLEQRYNSTADREQPKPAISHMHKI